MIFSFNPTKVQMSTPFLRVGPWFFAHVFNVPLPTLLRMGFFIYCFAENVGSLKTKTSPSTTKTRIPGEKKQKQKPKKQSLKARQGHIEHVCKISGSNSQKRRGHWYLKEFGVLCLNQPLFKLRHLLQVVWTRLNSYRCVNKAVSYITAKWASYYSSFKRKSSQKFSTIRVLCLLGLTVFPILLVAAIPVTIFSYSGLNPSQLQP